MNSRRAAGLVALVATLSLAGPGCRDLVEPREPRVEASSVSVRVLGLEGHLNDAIVTIDSRSWSSAGDVWEAVTDRGEATFPGAEQGIYDVHVAPRYGSGTPAWTVPGAELGPGFSQFEYPAVPVVAELDWPGIDDREDIDPGNIGVSFRYRLPSERAGSGYTEHARETGLDDDGLYRTTLPWYGTFELRAFAANSAFIHSYVYPDSVTVGPATVVRPALPLRYREVAFEAGGAPVSGGELQLQVHPSFSGYTSGSNRLLYLLDLDAVPDSLPLLPLAEYRLVLIWRDGPVFNPVQRLVDAPNPLPSTLELGQYAVELRAETVGGEPLPGTEVRALDESSWFSGSGPVADGTGAVRMWLDAGAHMVLLEHPEGYAARKVFEITGDQTVVVGLETGP